MTPGMVMEIGRTAIGTQADVAETLQEIGAFARNDDVTHHRNARRHAHRWPTHSSDEGHVQIADYPQHRIEVILQPLTRIAQWIVGAQAAIGQIGPARKGPPMAAQYNRPRLIPRLLQRRDGFFRHQSVLRVQHIGLIIADKGNFAAHFIG